MEPKAVPKGSSDSYSCSILICRYFKGALSKHQAQGRPFAPQFPPLPPPTHPQPTPNPQPPTPQLPNPPLPTPTTTPTPIPKQPAQSRPPRSFLSGRQRRPEELPGPELRAPDLLLPDESEPGGVISGEKSRGGDGGQTYPLWCVSFLLLFFEGGTGVALGKKRKQNKYPSPFWVLLRTSNSLLVDCLEARNPSQLGSKGNQMENRPCWASLIWTARRTSASTFQPPFLGKRKGTLSALPWENVEPRL